MKNFKKVLSLVLAVLMVVGGLVIAPTEAKAAEPTYTKVTDVNQVLAGGDFVLVAENEGKYYAVPVGTSGKLTATEVQVTDGVLTGDAPIWKVTSKNTDSVTFSSGDDYLGWSSKTDFATKTKNDGEAIEWLVEGSTDAFTFKIKASTTTSTTRYIAYQISGNRFGPYAGGDGYVTTFSIYKSSQAAAEPTVLTTQEIMDTAYGLTSGGSMTGSHTLSGKIETVDTMYGVYGNNVSVTIRVDGDSSNRTMYCYKLSGTDSDKITVGDTITVKGAIKNFNGTVEYDAPTLQSVTYETHTDTLTGTDATTESKILIAAFAAKENKIPMIGEYTLTGVIAEVDEAGYNSSYGNITVTIKIGEKTIECYRLSGTGADTLKKNDTITVKGELGYTSSAVRFLQGCQLVSVDSYVEPDSGNNSGSTDNDNTNTGDNAGNNNTGSTDTGNNNTDNNTSDKNETTSKLPTLAEMKATLDALYALEDGEALDGTHTLVLKITEIVKEPYDYTGKDGTVKREINLNAVVEGDERVVYCYGMSADASIVNNLKVGDTIVVTGQLKNYKGTYEYNLPTFTMADDTINKTGDTTNYALYFMLVLAGAGLVVASVVGKKKMA